uniref:Uncharacterized protein n=1 Tax=Avena sativa TaxID=4498 RepID=A0ACD5TBR2_AVESA
MGQDMALVHHVDDFHPMDEELATVAGKQSVLVDDCDNPDGGVGYGPLRTVRPQSVQNGQEKPPGSRYKVRANRTREKKTTTGFTNKAYKRKRGRPEGSKSARSKIDQKPVLLDSSSSSSSYNKGVEDDPDFELPTPTRKRGRPVHSKYNKRKIEQQPLLVDSSSSSSEGKKDKDDHLQPERKRGRPAGSKSDREQKLVLLDSSSGSSSYNKGVEDNDFEPPTPTRKRGRPARPKYAKRKTEQEPLLVDSNSSSSEGKKGEDDNFQPEVSDDDGLKKYACVKGTALDRAEELEKKLPAEGPSFIKSMKHSQVVQGFWLGLPALFCRKYLPDHDLNIVLEDEEGEICNTNYLAYKTGLSGGWKGFTEQHDLEIGNVLVFHLVQPTRFKVYILRENKLSSTDGVLGHLSQDTSMENTTPKKDEEESSDQDIKSKEEEPEVVTGDNSNASRDDSDNLASKEAAGGAIRSPSPDAVDFVAVKRLLDFKIEELKLRRTGVMKQLRYFESSVSILNDTLKEIDSEMEAMMEASKKKQKDQAVRKLAAAPW